MAEQCDWTCPNCGGRCGGVKRHEGLHQCPTHYKPPKQEYSFARFLYNEEYIRLYITHSFRPERPKRVPRGGFINSMPYFIAVSGIQVVTLISYLPSNITRKILGVLSKIFSMLKSRT